MTADTRHDAWRKQCELQIKIRTKGGKNTWIRQHDGCRHGHDEHIICSGSGVCFEDVSVGSEGEGDEAEGGAQNVAEGSDGLQRMSARQRICARKIAESSCDTE